MTPAGAVGVTRQDPSRDSLGARQLACVLAAGAALLGLLAILPAPGTSSVGLGITAGAAFGLAVAVAAGAERLPELGLSLLMALGSCLVAAALYFRGGAVDAWPLLYLAPVVFSFCFLSRHAALATLGVAVASCAVALGLMSDPPDRAFELWSLTTLALAATGAAVAFMRSRFEAEIEWLANAARTDPLTGLVNRRGFEESFELELERARRGERKLSLLVGDLDNFKQVNDRHGHQAGDSALERASRVLVRRKRRIDTVARLGGEEFALLVPDANERDSYMLAERLRSAVSEEFGAGPERLTISFGIASYPDHGDSYESLLGAADDALYAAKELGRDRSVIFSREVPGILGPAGRERPRDDHLETLLTLAEALDLREDSAPRHSRRVGRYAALIARELGLPNELIERLRLAGVLHDVGKIALPDLMLSKPEPLTEHEWTEMRRHPEIGAHILSNARLGDIGRWVLAHHERPDGRGFPLGLSNGDIPLEARILAVADAYVAMTSERPYRAAMEHEDARAELRSNAGGQFDERVVEAFLVSLAREEATA